MFAGVVVAASIGGIFATWSVVKQQSDEAARRSIAAQLVDQRIEQIIAAGYGLSIGTVGGGDDFNASETLTYSGTYTRTTAEVATGAEFAGSINFRDIETVVTFQVNSYLYDEKATVRVWD
jgi:Flp pilus assembly protein TadG